MNPRTDQWREDGACAPIWWGRRANISPRANVVWQELQLIEYSA
jgi:hypothetical protein